MQVLRSDQHFERKAAGQVTINNIQESHEGDYMCVASNVAGNSTYIVTIDVQGGFMLLRINKFLEISPSTAFQARAVTCRLLCLRRLENTLRVPL